MKRFYTFILKTAQILFLILSCSGLTAANAVESGPNYSVPNSGSPYVNLDDIENNGIVHIPTGLSVTLGQMMDVISGSRVIYIGETHDNLEAHRIQKEIIQRLAARFPGKIAVGMEMFRRSSQEDLDRWSQGTLPEKEFKKLVRKDWGPQYRLYQLIFKTLRQHSIPLYGLKSSRETEDLFRRGEPLPGLEVYPELDMDDIYHKPYAMSFFGGHETHAKALEKPYRMLLLWEETMAKTVAEFLNAPDRADWKLVVLAGGFHVQYGFGIPKRAFRRAPHAFSIVLPGVTRIPEELKDREMEVKHVPIPLYGADFAWKIDYKVLPENKIRLGVRLRETETGVEVMSVADGSNAQRAGIVAGDNILSMQGETVLDIEDLVRRLQSQNINDRITLKIQRGAADLDLEVVLKN